MFIFENISWIYCGTPPFAPSPNAIHGGFRENGLPTENVLENAKCLEILTPNHGQK